MTECAACRARNAYRRRHHNEYADTAKVHDYIKDHGRIVRVR